MKKIISIFIIYFLFQSHALSERIDVYCEGISEISLMGHSDKSSFFDEYEFMISKVAKDNQITFDKKLQVRPAIIKIQLINSDNFFSRDLGSGIGWLDIFRKNDLNKSNYESSYFQIKNFKIIDIITKDYSTQSGAYISNIQYRISLSSGKLIYNATYKNSKKEKYDIALDADCFGLDKVKKLLSQKY